MTTRKRAAAFRLFSAISLALVLLAAPGGGRTAGAQKQAGVQLTTRVGFDGFCDAGTWVPVRVLIENTGADIDGRLQVSYLNSDGSTGVVAADVLLPAGARKQFFLYLFHSGSIRNPQAELLSNGDPVARQELRISCLESIHPIFGVLADSPGAYDFLGDVRPIQGSVRVAQLQLDDLPDRPQGWAALDALVVAGVDTGLLTQDQRAALDLWLAGGGKLLVVGGPGWQAAAAGLDGVLALEPSAVRTVTGLAGLQALVETDETIEGEAILTVGRLRPEADVLAEQDGLPVVAEMPVGFGQAFYLGADPALQPLSEWEGMTELYERLLGAASQRPPWSDGLWNLYSASEAVSTLSERGIPAYAYICCWLAVYVAVIGPLHWLVIRRTKRRELAWLTIPGLVLLFAGLNYAFGAVYRGPRPVLNRLAVVQGWQGSDTALLQGAVGLYSPRRARYTLTAPDPTLFYPFQGQTSVLSSRRDWLAEQEEGRTVLPDLPVEVGGLSAFSVWGSVPAVRIDHDLTLTIGDANPILAGEITNASSYELHDVMLVTIGGWRNLPDLGPGETVPVTIPLLPPGSSDFYSLDAPSILGISYPDLSRQAEAFRRQAWLEAVTMPADTGGYYGYSTEGRQRHWGVHLIGWLEEAVLPIEVQGAAFDVIDTTIVSVQLQPALQTSRGPMKITHNLMAWESTLPGASPYGIAEIPQGGYTLRFRPAYPIEFSSVAGLSLTLTETSYGGSVAPAVSLWDFQAGRWVRIPNADWGETEISEPQPYVSGQGEIRLQLDNPSGDWISLAASTFTLVVEP